MQAETVTRADLASYAQNPETRPDLPEGIRPVDIIIKTRDEQPLTREEMFGWINGITSGKIPDYQASAWLMAVYKQGNNYSLEETINLTLAMAASGDVLDLDDFGIVTDKHSSGGVGDKTSLVVVPIIAALGFPVGKMSGRGLGHSGGTIDKLESIPGYRVDLTKEEFLAQLSRVGIVLTGQSADLAPADGKLYALRDVTGTVESIPLIAASIMSKKIASGATHLVLDVKVGEGAFMETLDDARLLAQIMVDIGKSIGMKVEAEISDMNQPLGEAVGNSLEVLEAIETLNNSGPADFTEHCINTAARIVLLAGGADTLVSAHRIVTDTIKNGTALVKFRELVEAQGGDVRVIDDPIMNLRIAKSHPVIYTGESGFTQAVNPRVVGETAMDLGGGRKKKGDAIDYSVGVVMQTKIGQAVRKGDIIGYVFTDDETKVENATNAILRAVTVGEGYVEPPPLIYEVIS